MPSLWILPNHPIVMGVLNVTPDSFSDGGCYTSTVVALDHACRMIEEGAAIIDVGGESTRPNAAPVSLQQEMDRVMPILEGLQARGIPCSIDTYKPALMQEAIRLGVAMINDVRALQEPGALEVAANSSSYVCLMHMQGQPQFMQQQPHYDDVVAEVGEFLRAQAKLCIAAGINASRIILDPGFGFGKTATHNLQLLHELRTLTEGEFPVLVGLSRKSLIQAVLHRPVSERLAGSLALATWAIAHGARIIRAHDVQATVDAVKMTTAILRGEA